MAGTLAGGKKAAATNLKRYGKDFYSVISAKGGKVKNPNKGFGADRELARAAGHKGGQASRRPPDYVVDEKRKTNWIERHFK